MWPGAVKFIETDTIARSVAKNLPTWAVLGVRADTLAVTTAVLEWRVAHSAMITLTPASIVVEDSRLEAPHSVGAFTFARVMVENLSM